MFSESFSRWWCLLARQRNYVVECQPEVWQFFIDFLFRRQWLSSKFLPGAAEHSREADFTHTAAGAVSCDGAKRVRNIREQPKHIIHRIEMFRRERLTSATAVCSGSWSRHRVPVASPSRRSRQRVPAATPGSRSRWQVLRASPGKKDRRQVPVAGPGR